jgi:hypothetical protein
MGRTFSSRMDGRRCEWIPFGQDSGGVEEAAKRAGAYGRDAGESDADGSDTVERSVFVGAGLALRQEAPRFFRISLTRRSHMCTESIRRRRINQQIREFRICEE